MKRFVKQLLPLGALLIVTAMPIQAAAADQPNVDLNEVLKNTNCYTSQCDTYLNQSVSKWSTFCGEAECREWVNQWVSNWQKPECKPLPDIPVIPDVDTPEAPDQELPEQPEEPVLPDQPEIPVLPEKPEIPVLPEKPEIPVLPEKPEVPDNDNDGNQQLSGYQQQVVNLVNKERGAAGLSALKVNVNLAKVAERKAVDMRDNNYFSHTSPTYGSPFDMMKQFGIKYTSAGENIAKGQKTPQSVMNGWMNSQGHKDNIMNAKYTEIGVGYVTDSRGDTYWVQMFIRP